MKKLIFILLMSGLIGAAAQAGAGQISLDGPSPSFERLKSLVGTWEGTVMVKGEVHKVAAEYQLTSAGNAILERLYPGEPYEMISVYYDQGRGKVSLTHFSMGRNTPQLELRAATRTEMRFLLAKESRLNKSKKHMRSLGLEWIDEDNIVRKWTSFKGSKPQATTVLSFTRVRNVMDLAMNKADPEPVEASTDIQAREDDREEAQEDSRPARKKRSPFRVIKGAWTKLIGD